MAGCDRKEFKYEQLGEVSYIIGKWSLKFDAKDLFNLVGDNQLRFGIYGHKGKDFFLLGYYLFKKISLNYIYTGGKICL